MPKILAVTEEMERRASSIGVNADDILSIQNAVTNIFQNMGRDFSGRIPSLMTEYKDFLSNAARTMEWTDAEGARLTRSLGLAGGE